MGIQGERGVGRRRQVKEVEFLSKRDKWIELLIYAWNKKNNRKMEKIKCVWSKTKVTSYH
jgi:hypothetical protein